MSGERVPAHGASKSSVLVRPIRAAPRQARKSVGCLRLDFARRANLPHPDGHCLNPQIRAIIRASRTHQRGASRSSRTFGRGTRWTRRCRRTNGISRGRRSRVVLAPRRWRQVGDDASHHADDGGKKARSPRRARRKPLKPSRGECRVDPAEPVVTAACFSCCRRAMGEAITRHSPRPLIYSRAVWLQDSDAPRRENAISCQQLSSRRPGVRGDDEEKPKAVLPLRPRPACPHMASTPSARHRRGTPGRSHRTPRRSRGTGPSRRSRAACRRASGD